MSPPDAHVHFDVSEVEFAGVRERAYFEFEVGVEGEGTFGVLHVLFLYYSPSRLTIL